MAYPTSIIKNIKGTSASEWAEHAGLNWDAEKLELNYFPDDGISRKSSMVSIVRNDTGQELGVVSPKYQIVQPRDILSGFESAVNNLGAGFEMDGIGMFDDGKIIWGRASSDRPIRIHGQDSLQSYLYMLTSFDGSAATVGFVSTLRAICSNALHVASERSDKLFSLSHRSKYQGHAKSALDTYMKRVDNFERDVNKLADTRVAAPDVVRYYKELLYGKKEELTEREKTTVNKYLYAAVHGAGSKLTSVQADETGMSAWGLVNGVTNLIDHDPVRKVGDNTKSAFIGSGNALKVRAWNRAMKLAA